MRYRNQYRFGLGLAASGLCGGMGMPALAAGSMDVGPAIIVIGKELPPAPGAAAYGTVLIERDRLGNSASGRIEGLLPDVAGFQQYRRSDSRSANPSAQGATVRALGGNASSRSLVLLDGVPMADPFFGYIPFSALVPERLSAVRVTRGGGSSAFGAGAVAGTIELVSAGKGDLPLLTSSAYLGSNDALEVSASLTPGFETGFLSLSGRYENGDGFFTAPKSQRASAVPAAYESWSAQVRGVVALASDLDLQVRGLGFRDDRTLRFAGADSMSRGKDASLRLIGRGEWGLDALAYFQARNFSNVVISANSLRKILDQRDTPSQGMGGKVEIRPPVGANHVLRLGIDGRRVEGDMFEDAFNGGTGALTEQRHAGGRQDLTGVFVESDWTLGAVVLVGGVRADRWSIANGFFETRSADGAVTSDLSFATRDGAKINGHAGAALGLGATTRLRIAGYTNFRLPTLNELYRPFTIFPVTTRANAALGAERLKGMEMGIDLQPLPEASLGMTIFYNRLDDAIANVTIGTNLRQRQNVDAIVTKGVEVDGRIRRGAWSLRGSYAYNASRVTAPGQAFDGFTPAQSPRHMASATMAWDARSGWGVSATLRYVAQQYEDDLETDVLPAAITADAVGRVAVGDGVTLVVRAENLFDERVVTRNAGGSIDLGSPRAIWIGVRVER